MTIDTLDNSLDLSNLFAHLWEQRYRMIAVALIGVLLALLYIKLSEPRWGSVTAVDRPSFSQGIDYYTALQQLKILAAAQAVVQLEPVKLTSKFYPLFLFNLQAEDNQKALWSQPNLPKRFRIVDHSKFKWQPRPNRIGFTSAEFHKTTHDIIQLQANSPRISQPLLQQYLKFASKQTWADLQSEWQFAGRGLNAQTQLQKTKARHYERYSRSHLQKAKWLPQYLKFTLKGFDNQHPRPNIPKVTDSGIEFNFAGEGYGALTGLPAWVRLMRANTPSYFSFPCGPFLAAFDKPGNKDNPPVQVRCWMWRFAAALLTAILAVRRQPEQSKV